MRWVLLACAVSALTLAVLWRLFVTAPSPEEVCAHKIELARASVGDRDPGPLLEQLTRSCVENAARKIQMRGKIKYANYAKCVVAAPTLDEAEHCSTGSPTK